MRHREEVAIDEAAARIIGKLLAEHLHPGGVFALWSNDPPEDAFERALAGAFATSVAHIVTFDNASGDRDASNTVYVGVKTDLPIQKATIEPTPSAD